MNRWFAFKPAAFVGIDLLPTIRTMQYVVTANVFLSAIYMHYRKFRLIFSNSGILFCSESSLTFSHCMQLACVLRWFQPGTLWAKREPSCRAVVNGPWSVCDEKPARDLGWQLICRRKINQYVSCTDIRMCIRHILKVRHMVTTKFELIVW